MTVADYMDKDEAIAIVGGIAFLPLDIFDIARQNKVGSLGLWLLRQLAGVASAASVAHALHGPGAAAGCGTWRASALRCGTPFDGILVECFGAVGGAFGLKRQRLNKAVAELTAAGLILSHYPERSRGIWFALSPLFIMDKQDFSRWQAPATSKEQR